MTMSDNKYGVDDLVYLMARLRNPDTGCPWDKKQNFASIVPFTLEETYEVIDAIERADYAHLPEELGDLLFQVIFYGQIAAEQDLFDFYGIVDGLVRKLIARHPHVFPEGTLASVRSAEESVATDQIKDTWEASKARARQQKGATGRLADVPLPLPALSRAQKLQKRAARHGFDWQDKAQVMAKIEEELAEVNAAIRSDNIDHVEDELGDLIFACVNLARHTGLDAEFALRRANRKFESRFAHMERGARESQQNFDDLSMAKKNRLWELAKRAE